MTIEKLIEKMESEKGKNGIYNVLKSHVKTLKEEIPYITEIGYNKWLVLQEKKDSSHNFILGMLWGLRYSNTITSEEHQEILDDMFNY